MLTYQWYGLPSKEIRRQIQDFEEMPVIRSLLEGRDIYCKGQKSSIHSNDDGIKWREILQKEIILQIKSLHPCSVNVHT